MPTTKQIVKTEITDPDNNPGVIAYRVGQLEKTVIEGFRAHNEKLDVLTQNFATKEELRSVQNKLNDWRWYFRALVTAVMLALATAISGFIINHR